MELTPGILKSVESLYYQEHKCYNTETFILKHLGNIVYDYGKVKTFRGIGPAKAFLTKYVERIFRHGEYWQENKDILKTQYKYDIDYSETIKIFPSYGYTSRFYEKESKKLFKDIATNLLKENIFTLENLK